MKKILSVLILIAIVALGCSSKKQQADAAKQPQDMEFEYTAMSRGIYRKANVTKNGIRLQLTHDGEGEKKSISGDNWNRLVALYQDEVVAKELNIEELEAPSKKHQFDGALHANLVIKANGQTYNSVTFDHGNPPHEIAGLTKQIISLSGLDTK